jgi:quercetin dioxygenase-like cupin family protein
VSFTAGGPSRGGVTVSHAADRPDLPGPPTVRFVAPGSVTSGRYGLFEYAMGPRSPGPGPHYHRTFSESFYILTGELTIFAEGSWTTFGSGDYVYVPEHGVHGFRNDGDVPASFLILFAPGIARERFFTELAGMRERGVELTPEERVAFYARHDQVNLE